MDDATTSPILRLLRTTPVTELVELDPSRPQNLENIREAILDGTLYQVRKVRITVCILTDGTHERTLSDGNHRIHALISAGYTHWDDAEILVWDEATDTEVLFRDQTLRVA